MSERWKIFAVHCANRFLHRFGYSVEPHVSYAQAWRDERLSKAWSLAAPYTMIGEARLWSLMDAVSYVSARSVPGDIVECGVWKGGAVMAAAQVLSARNDTHRKVWLYDTFEGLPPPEPCDVSVLGQDGRHEWKRRTSADGSGWCRASLEEVQRNVSRTSYPRNQFQFHKGKVEETIPAAVPSSISLLRLDLDWYRPTKHVLNHLFPKLSPGGVLIIDDYGHWAGARKAVDEYFNEHSISLWLFPVDYTCRMGIRSTSP